MVMTQILMALIESMKVMRQLFVVTGEILNGLDHSQATHFGAEKANVDRRFD
jgi:hypothetical protein